MRLKNKKTQKISKEIIDVNIFGGGELVASSASKEICLDCAKCYLAHFETTIDEGLMTTEVKEEKE